MDIYAKLKEILSELVSKDSIDIDSITPETELDELGFLGQCSAYHQHRRSLQPS